MSGKFLKLLLMVGVLFVSTQALALTNGNFNTGDLTGWSPYVADPTNSVSVIDPGGSGGYDGSPYLEIVALAPTDSDNTNVTQTFDLTAGDTVGISFDFKMTLNAGTTYAGGGVGVNYYDDSWTYLGYGWADLWDTGGSWTSFTNSYVSSGTWTAPTNAAHAVLKIGPYTGSDGTVTYDVDNVLATPEPATMVLLGLGGLVLRRRKRA